MQKQDLRRFVTGFLERAGAVIEETGYELAEALLPDELAAQFKDHMLLAFDYEVARENPSASFVTYGSPLLDAVARLAARYGRCTALYCPDPGQNPGRRFDREIANRLEFLRCRPPSVVYQWMAGHVFWGFYFRTVFRSYERTEELVAVVVDGYSGLPVPGFERWWGTVAPAEEPQYQLPQAESLPISALYRSACREAERKAGESALAFQRQASGRMAGEVAKVSDYYGQMARELEKKMGAAEDPAKKDRLARQLEATRLDWQRREKDTAGRYAVEVELRLDHLVAYHLPRMHIKLELQHKDRVLNTTVLYNLLSGSLELPVCPICRQPAARLVPDRENRLICLNHGWKGQ